MSNYYEKRNAKVNIAHELMNRGWEVFGYKADESDSMTDYYSPANWDGIATKNGFVLVVDTKYSGNSGRIQTQRNFEKNNNFDKIEKLSRMTQENGCTAAEEQNAKDMINKLKENNKVKENVVCVWPEFMVNPKGCIWHIEKEGAIVAKGRTLTTFAAVPESYMFDINKEEYKENYKYCYTWDGEKVERKLNEKETAAVKAFKKFLSKIESAVAVKIGEGEEEKLIKVIEEKKTIKLVKQQIDRKESLQPGDVVYIDSSTGYVKILEVHEGHYTSIKVSGRTWKESKSRHPYVNLNRKSFDGSLNRGFLKVYNIEEVEEIEMIEKWVKDKKQNKTTKKAAKTVNTFDKDILLNESLEVEEVEKVVLNEEKNGVEIYFTGKPSEEVRNNLKSNGFRWSKYNKCWYAKQNEDTINFANTFTTQTEEKIKESSEQYKEDKEKEILNKLNDLNINDIESYTIDLDLSKRENSVSMFRSKDINHTQQLQNYLTTKQNEILEVLKDCNNKQIEYTLKMALQRFKRDYHTNYIKQLQHRAENPSWAVTGRSGRDMRRDEKMNNRYNNLLKESLEITSKLDKAISKAKNNIKKFEKSAIKKHFEDNTKDITIPKFNRVKKEYQLTASKEIFKGGENMYTTTMYEYQDYYIFKNWGSFRVYDSIGNELYNTKTQGKLEDAKKWLIYYLNNKVSKAV